MNNCINLRDVIYGGPFKEKLGFVDFIDSRSQKSLSLFFFFLPLFLLRHCRKRSDRAVVLNRGATALLGALKIYGVPLNSKLEVYLLGKSNKARGAGKLLYCQGIKKG